MKSRSHRIRLSLVGIVVGVASCSTAESFAPTTGAEALIDRFERLCPDNGEAGVVKAALDRLRGGNPDALSTDRRPVAELSGAAEASREATQYDDAQKLFALAIFRGLEQGVTAESEIALSLAKLAQILQWRSVYADAKALYLCAEETQRRRLGEADPATAMTTAYLADFERQFDHLDDAERLFRDAMRRLDVPDSHSRSELAYAVTGLAHVLRSRNASDPQVLALYRQAVALNESDERCRGKCLAAAVSQDNLGQHLTLIGRYAEAEPLLLGALDMKERLRGAEHDTSATTANGLARLYEATGRMDSALVFHRRAVFAVYAEAQTAATTDSAVLSRLAELSADLARFLDEHKSANDAQDAVFYYKQSVNARQRMRAGAATMSASYRDSLARVVADTYYRLARLLAAQGRLQEAEQVLLALKDAEFFQFVRGSVEVEASPVTLTPQERRLQAELDDLAHRLGKAYAALGQAQAGAGTSSRAFSQSQAELAGLQMELSQALDAVSSRLASAPQPSEQHAPIKDSRLARVASSLSSSPTGESVAIVMYAPEKRLTTVIVTGADGTTAFPLAEGDGTEVLDPLISRMRTAIQSRTDYREPAKALYMKLIAPVRSHLKERGLAPAMLMLYLTGRLRLLPFAALMDDEGRFLVERYRLSTLSPLSIPEVDVPPKGDWSVQAFGSSIAWPGMRALPAVEDELSSIVQSNEHPSGTLPGEEFLNSRFTRAAWQGVLSPEPGAPPRRPVIHVATHFSSPPPGKSWLSSFLILGTGEHFQVSDLSAIAGVDLRDVELLTLSACSTEFVDAADGSEFEGLGMVFQKKGAQAVIGTLWAIDDLGGSLLMKSFYAARGAHRAMSKAAALQQAQLAMIRGQIHLPDDDIDPSHPYYWAPFILVGNWQ